MSGQEMYAPFLIFMALPQYAGIFKHKFLGDYPNKSCVYKIWAGDKFYIWKCQALHNSMYHIGGETERKIRLGVKPTDAFAKYIACLINDQIEEVAAEMLFLSEDPIELLKFEYKELKAAEGNPLCLNVLFDPHISRWMGDVSTQFNSWKESLNSK